MFPQSGQTVNSWAKPSTERIGPVFRLRLCQTPTWGSSTPSTEADRDEVVLVELDRWG